MEQVKTAKLQWINWMKATGMLCVIWTHCFPQTMTSFLLAFDVPVFFMMSGYLSRKKYDSATFYSKLFKTLIIPYLILSYIKAAGPMLKTISNGDWLNSAVGILLGFHTFHDVQGCSNLWFVYTLILLKVIHHHTQSSLKLLTVVSVIFLAAEYALSMYYAPDNLPKWGISDTLLALPLFTIGYYLRLYHEQDVNNFITKIKSSRTISLVAAIILFVITWFIGYFNGDALLFYGSYGNNLILFFIGSITGTLALFIICVLLEKVQWRYLGIIAAGNLVTLTFHRELQHEPLILIRDSSMPPYMQDLSSFLMCVIIMLIFIPVNKLIARYAPIILGGRK